MIRRDTPWVPPRVGLLTPLQSLCFIPSFGGPCNSGFFCHPGMKIKTVFVLMNQCRGMKLLGPHSRVMNLIGTWNSSRFSCLLKVQEKKQKPSSFVSCDEANKPCRTGRDLQLKCTNDMFPGEHEWVSSLSNMNTVSAIIISLTAITCANCLFKQLKTYSMETENIFNNNDQTIGKKCPENSYLQLLSFFLKNILRYIHLF